MKDNEIELNTEKKSIRGRFVIQEVVESDLNIRDSTKKRKSTLKSSKFKLIAKTVFNENKKTLFYVYNNSSYMYVPLESVLKQYSIIYDSISIPNYLEGKGSKNRLKLSSINQTDSDHQISYIPNIKDDYFQPNYEICEKTNLLKRIERKRIDSNVELKRNSPFDQPKKIQNDSFNLKKFILMDNNDALLYSIQHAVSFMFESQQFIEEKICSCCFEL